MEYIQFFLIKMKKYKNIRLKDFWQIVSDIQENLNPEIEHLIYINIEKYKDIINKYCPNFSPQINDSLFEYLISQIQLTNFENKIKIIICNPEWKSYWPLIQKLVNDEIEFQSKIILKEIWKNNKLALGLLITWVIWFFILAYISNYTNKAIPFVVDIACWVFIWEAIDLIFLDKRKQRSKYYKLAQLYLAEYEDK